LEIGDGGRNKPGGSNTSLRLMSEEPEASGGRKKRAGT